MAGRVPEIALGSSKTTIPCLGFGTAEFPFGGNRAAVKEAVLNAIKLGYRHFDTAAVYESEQPLGEAVAEALRLGLIESRNQLFITSKLEGCDSYGHLVLPALQKTLQNLKLEYIDLYLIHYPISLKPGVTFSMNKDDLVPIDLKSVWEAMEECQNLGLTKSIGASNFSCKKLETILNIAKIPPSVNQVEMHPLWQQKKLRDFCEEKGVLVAAYSPLGAKGTFWGTNAVMENRVLAEIAEEKGKSVAQVCLRWGLQQGVCVVVKSFNEERMKQNLDIFDWELSEEEMDKIRGITPQCKAFRGEHLVSPNGPYKSVEELWDGEI